MINFVNHDLFNFSKKTSKIEKKTMIHLISLEKSQKSNWKKKMEAELVGEEGEKWKMYRRRKVKNTEKSSVEKKSSAEKKDPLKKKIYFW